MSSNNINKKCNKCEKSLPRDFNFHKRKTSPDGFNTICIDCVKTAKPRKRKHWENGKLLCLVCNEYKDVNSFSTNCANIHRRSKDRRCNNCRSKQYQRRREQNRGKKDLDRMLLERWHGVKERAARKDREVEFDVSFLKELWNQQNGKCALSDIEMTFIYNNGRTPTNVSVDRIDGKLSYTKDNTQLVCMAVNQMKNDLTNEQLFFFCEQVLKHNLKRNI